MQNRYYIGVVGSLASGKGVVADYFIKNYGFVSFSLSFIVHKELKARHVGAFSRNTLQDIGDDLRQEFGDGVLAERAIDYLKTEGNTRMIIEGIRNPGEVAYLRKLPNFILVSVDADQSLRFRRVIERMKPWDPRDWETFLKVDGRDQGDKLNVSGQQVAKCMKKADFRLKNNKDLETLYADIERMVVRISSGHPAYARILDRS